MMITNINNTNPFPLLNDIYLDAANPNANAASIPADNSLLASWTDLGVHRNVFSQASSAVQPTYKRNVVNGQNAVLWDGNATYMICPYDATKNGYIGPMTITIVAMCDIDPGLVTHNCIFGVDSFSDGFATGIEGTSYAFTQNGISDDVSNPGFIAQNVWQVFSMRTNNVNSVDFFKNGVLVDTQPADPMAVDLSNRIIGGFNSTLTGFNWSGPTTIISQAWTQLTNQQIQLLHKYAMGRFRIS